MHFLQALVNTLKEKKITVEDVQLMDAVSILSYSHIGAFLFPAYGRFSVLICVTYVNYKQWSIFLFRIGPVHVYSCGAFHSCTCMQGTVWSYLCM